MPISAKIELLRGVTMDTKHDVHNGDDCGHEAVTHSDRIDSE